MTKDYRNASDKTAGGAKLTAEAVRMYRIRYRRDEVTVRGIAQMHSMSAEAVRRMLRGETWAWVTDEPPEEVMQARIVASQERLMRLLEQEGERKALGIEAQQELGIPIPEHVKEQAEILTGRKFESETDDVSPPDGEHSGGGVV